MIDKAKYGDVIYVERILYNHYGIYSGNGRVIHYEKSDGDEICDGIIAETSIEEFLDGSTTYHVCNFSNEPDSFVDMCAHFILPVTSRLVDKVLLDKERNRFAKKTYSAKWTVARARKKIGTHGYDLFFHNCEHFAIWCKTGIADSWQVTHFPI